jgi:hypothetical protein
MTVRALCRILGWGLIAVGLFGFFEPRFLGMHLTPLHNIIHLASGAASLYVGMRGSPTSARRFALAFGIVYFALGVLGFVAPDLTARVIGHEPVPTGDLAPDNAVHLILGGAFVAASAARTRTRERTPATAAARRR